MGLFDSLFGRNKKQQEKPNENHLLEQVEVAPGIILPKVFADLWPDIQKSAIQFASIKATPKEDLALEESKFGHYPCIPLDFDYPKDSEGMFMYPLAQINCKDIPALKGYPESGYLQFYITAFDEVYGLDFDNQQSQKNFRVLYFTEKETEQFKVDFSFLDEVMQVDTLPVYKPHALEKTKSIEYQGLWDVRYEKQEINLLNIAKQYPTIEDELWDSVHEAFPSNGHKIGGYAYFTQDDPRFGHDIFKDYILLLQIDSDDEIMWGDVGVANFFIHPDDLSKKDFSKVMYSWDCS